MSEKRNKQLFLGLDIGTMNIVLSNSESEEIKLTRNVFLPIEQDSISKEELDNLEYVINEDNEIFIIGDDAFKFANIFSKEVNRPMKEGLISPDEINAVDILTLIIKSLVGDISSYEDIFCCYSIPAEAIDEKKSVTYHERVFGSILNSLGVNNKAINEAIAIIYSECQKEKFSGVGVSFGAGMCNVSLAYKGIEALKFSTARSGDYIDRNVAMSLSIVPNRVTAIKEKYLDLSNPFGHINLNKKTKRVIEALVYYYESVLEYTIKKLIKQFNDKVDLEIDEELPIVVSGGTSLPKGFIELFKNLIEKYELPFNVLEIRRAKNPLTAVSEGLLIKSMTGIFDRIQE